MNCSVDRAPGVRRVAVVDLGSFVLPYDYHLVEGLSRLGYEVEFFGSRTRYNSEFLEAMRQLPGVQLRLFDVSRSVATRRQALKGYLGVLAALWKRRKAFEWINLQFCGRWLVEWLYFSLLRQRFIWTVHNSVPHGFAGRRYLPYQCMAAIARALWFPSEFSASDFYQRYGERFRAKGRVVQHGLLAIRAGQAAMPYRVPDRLEGLAYWSTVKPYKGIELLLALARRRMERGGCEAIEVHGLWDGSLHPIRDELRALGVVIEDHYLDSAELARLLSRDLVFLLPYRTASQSGALYTLVHAGRLFLATDVGDLGAFLRRHGLEGLIVSEADAASVERAMEYLQANLPEVVARFAAAQRSLAWDKILREADVAHPFGHTEAACGLAAK